MDVIAFAAGLNYWSLSSRQHCRSGRVCSFAKPAQAMITLYMPHVLNDGISVKQEGFRWFLVADFLVMWHTVQLGTWQVCSIGHKDSQPQNPNWLHHSGSPIMQEKESFQKKHPEP